MSKIPKKHPRYRSLVTREKLSDAMKKGLVHETGLIAHGRGEAFDYIIGEKTISIADNASRTAAAALLNSDNPVISVNGNVVALSAEQCISLGKIIPAKIEINLFHRSNDRIKRLEKELNKFGMKQIYGIKADAKIPDLNHNRGLCDKNGIYAADVVLVPLEDGDRCQALKKMGKQVITIDLNPLSRTAKTADITIVDNLTRALPNIEKWVKKLKNKDKKTLERILKSWDNEKMLNETLVFMSKKLNSL